VIRVENVGFEIDSREILKNISFRVDNGKTFVLIGPSGCGKSTILRNIIGLSTPTKGSIYFDDENIVGMNKKELNKIREQCGFLFQQSALFDSLTIEENLKFPLLQSKKSFSEKDMKRAINEKLEMVDIPGVNQMFPSELSGGMKKRAALARSIILEPKYIFYDEPTTGLDPIMSQVVGDLIKRLSNSLDITSIVVTHDMKLAYFVADNMALMNNGEIVVSGAVDTFHNSNHPFVKQFVNGESTGPIKLKSMG
jgi:phospholipid/cholesterol/gamma-HCH transport system ATP-binding protein